MTRYTIMYIFYKLEYITVIVVIVIKHDDMLKFVHYP